MEFSMSADSQAKQMAVQMIEYLKSKILRDDNVEILLDTSLVASGMIDSFALIDILLQLEKVTQRKISPGKVSPRDMDTVTLMLITAERVGKPRP